MTREEEIRAAHVGPASRLDGQVQLAEYDPAWPETYEREAARVREALGADVLRIEHVGSTSVPGLPAKPVIDLLLVLRDSADEAAYLPALEAAGYRLAIREPDWFQHRVLRRPGGPELNMHVFSASCSEIERMLLLRDRLRTDEADRALYARTKRELAAGTWAYVQDYADAKSHVVEEIIARARTAHD